MKEYKPAPERFDMASQAIEDLRGLAMTLQEIGSYSAQDEQALKLLILNLANAMGIIDPARSDALLAEKAKQYLAEVDGGGEVKEPPALGQYL